MKRCTKTVEQRAIELQNKWYNQLYDTRSGFVPDLDHFLIKAIIERIDRPPKRKGKV